MLPELDGMNKKSSLFNFDPCFYLSIIKGESDSRLLLTQTFGAGLAQPLQIGVWINWSSVFANLEMQMRTSTPAGRTGPTDNLTFGDISPAGDFKFR